MACLQAVEQAMGVQVPQVKPVSDIRGQKETCSSANKRFQAEILTRLSLIEGHASTSTAAAAATGLPDLEVTSAKPTLDRPRTTEPAAGSSSMAEEELEGEESEELMEVTEKGEDEVMVWEEKGTLKAAQRERRRVRRLRNIKEAKGMKMKGTKRKNK
ncbi:UNVERIFIED_CONTAM: hypothetical protein K2H54_004782 [Gekko kuhli]